MKTLRPYQSDALTRLKLAFLAGKRRIVLVLPTGAGKTLIASHIVAGALAKGGKAVFCAPMITLIDQTIAAFEAEGISHIGAMQAKHPRTDASAPVQVASVQTLQRRGEIPSASVVLVDEAHVFSKAVADWMRERPDLVFVGLTATPGRAGMADEWDDLVVGVTTRELIDQGYLSRYSVFAPSTADLSGVKIVRGEYQADGAAEAMSESGLVGDILSNYLLHGEGRPTLGFAVTVAHAKHMAERFTEAGIPSAYVEASTDTLERGAIRDAFTHGDIRVIWSVRTMTTGVDLPVSGIIDASPTRSAMLFQQKIGRGLRINPGTEDLIVWDHAGNTQRIGFVEDLDWSALPGGKRGEGERQQKTPTPKPCGCCGALMPPRVKVCPSCGTERKVPSGYIETADGELVPLKRDASRAHVAVSVKMDWYGSLLWIAAERGYAKGWAYFKYREKFGVAPAAFFPAEPVDPLPEVRSWVKHRQIAYAKAKQREALRHAG
jgi:DNA repair protein RadD